MVAWLAGPREKTGAAAEAWVAEASLSQLMLRSCTLFTILTTSLAFYRIHRKLDQHRVAAAFTPCITLDIWQRTWLPLRQQESTEANHKQGRVHDMELILLLHARLPMTIASGTRVLKQATDDDDDSKQDRLCGASRQGRLVVNCPTHTYSCIIDFGT